MYASGAQVLGEESEFDIHNSESLKRDREVFGAGDDAISGDARGKEVVRGEGDGAEEEMGREGNPEADVQVGVLHYQEQTEGEKEEEGRRMKERGVKGGEEVQISIKSVTKVDKGTQTEAQDLPVVNPAQQPSTDTAQYKLPQLPNTAGTQPNKSEYTRPWSSSMPQYAHHRSHSEPATPTSGYPLPNKQLYALPSWAKGIRPYSADMHVPRSVTSTRRLMSVYNFSKSEVLKRFHQEYPERAPDLRDYGIQEGKRHIIHGYKSYYFH